MSQNQGFTPPKVVARRAGPDIDFLAEHDGDVGFMPLCDVVVALWGATSGVETMAKVNPMLARWADDLAAAGGARLVLHASTGAVYSPSDEPLSEESETRPRHPYGASKLAAENIPFTSDARHVFLRLGNVAGADSLFRAICMRGPVTLDRFADGTTPRRSYVAPDDLAAVIQGLARRAPHDLPSVLNIAGRTPVAMGDIAVAAGAASVERAAPEGALPLHHLDTGALQRTGARHARKCRCGALGIFLRCRGLVMDWRKRTFDVLVALGLSVILVPLGCVVALVILFRDGTPVLYRSERMKTVDESFALLKFRTMSVVAHDAGVSGGHKSARITPLGAMLRRTRLDEIPQLWNVLRGDISFVGPRPPLREYVERFPETYRSVLRARPGITGLATLVYHRTEERLLAQCISESETDAVYARRCIPRKAALDEIYRANRTLLWDVRLMFATLIRSLGPRRR
ncbi:sugar transferase [Roseobacteraceae bacterium S113]